MISICAKESNNNWFCVAYDGEKIVATAINSDKEKTVDSILRNIPLNVEHRIVEKGSDFAQKTILMLKELHAGNEESKSFSLATEYLPNPVGKVLTTAAMIPIGYVTSYGNLARIADTGPRVVGRIMATNPLYPIVPCHRVVGADFSLIGYGGRKNPQALQAKLARLKKEVRGFTIKKKLPINGKKLTVYPVEYVINKAKSRGLDSHQQKIFTKK